MRTLMTKPLNTKIYQRTICSHYYWAMIKCSQEFGQVIINCITKNTFEKREVITVD